ncbi:MAG: lycopene cyclase domain-containing protein [Luteibaculum sp.]
MDSHWIYLALNLGTISIPLLASFYPKFPFYKHFLSYAKAVIPVAIFFVLWDIWFTDIGVWGFNSKYLLGIHINNLPLEEVLFFLCIPFACTFTYFTMHFFLPTKKHGDTLLKWAGYFGVFLIVWGLLNIQQWYTFSSFFLCGLFLVYIGWVEKPLWWKQFFVSFMLCMIPFYLVNGILTGSLVSEQVVWYSDQENLGIRFFTIPLEDHSYALLLLGLNVLLFEKFSGFSKKLDNTKTR